MKITLLFSKKNYFTFLLLFCGLVGFSQITQRGSATTATSTNTDLTIPKPAGISVGDLMIANIAKRGNNTDDPVLSGWTIIAGGGNGGTNYGGVLYKIASTADVSLANYTFALGTGSNSSVGGIIAFSGIDNTTPFDVPPGAITFNGAGNSTVMAGDITTISANAAVIMLAQVVNQERNFLTWTTASAGSLIEILYANQTGVACSIGGAWAIKATPGQTGAGSATLNNNARHGGILLALRPSPPPTIISLSATSGCVGGNITINGTNLTGATAANVKIGGTAVSSITSNSGNQIVAIIGSGTTGTVSITTAGGTATSVATFTINSGPTASAGAILASICQGGTTTGLNGSFGGSATGAVWSTISGGKFANNTGSTPGTATWTPPAGFTGTATLLLTTAGGSCGTTTASKTQVVGTGALATVASAMTIIGSLTSTSLGGNTPSPGSGAWTKISGPTGTVTFSNSTSGNSTATVPSLGTYIFRWTVTSTCGTSTADITVTYLAANSHREYTLFYEDFDASNGGWSNSTTTNGSWLWTSSFPTAIAEIGENSFWRLNNYGNYSNNSVMEIDSPVYNFTGYENLLFNIDVRYDTETNWDGMRILYSINGGAFVQLGSNGTGINWYNSTSVGALGSNGWSNNNATAALAFTPLGVGPNRFTRATTTLADAMFKNQSNVRFRVQFKSDTNNTDNGVAFDNVSVEGNPMVALALSPIAPAKVSQNLSLWFKSNAGIAVTDGAALTAWEDQAYDITRADLVNKENVKALADDAPTFRDNSTRNINFNPVVDFNAANKDYMNGKGGLYSQDYFIVVYPNDIVQNTMGTNGRQIPLGGKSDDSNFHEDPTGLGFGNTTARYTPDEVISHSVGAYAPGTDSPAPGVDSYGRAFTSTTVTYNEPLIINVKTNANGTQTEIFKNGIKIDNTAGRTGNNGDQQLLNFYEYRNLPFYLGTGRSGISGRTFSALNGRLSEVVAYTAPNSAINQQKIQSYLGLKYGITLHATGSNNVTSISSTTRLNDVDYIDSAGNIIWNTTANTGFNYDIAGVGRDDDSQLYQKQSKTVNSIDDITIGLTDISTTNKLNTSTCNDKNFLIWGNNNGTLAAQAPVIVNISSGITSPSTLITNVEFISIGRTWKVVKTVKTPETDVNNIHDVKVSIPTTMLTNTITPPGDFLMFISNTPSFDPTAEYRVMTVNGSNLETIYDFVGTKYITFGYAPEKTEVRSIKFNGSSDYMDAGKVLDLNPSFTVSAWINANDVNKTILSKRNSAFTKGYDLSINSVGKAEMSWFVGASKKTIVSNAVIPLGKWHHIGVTFDGSNAKMYIDGVNKVISPITGIPTATTDSFLIAAADGMNPTSFFNGSIDEVRVWKSALTEAQFRFVMNQEIQQNASKTRGKVIPPSISQNDIGVVDWTTLNVYYPMSTYTYTNAKDKSSYGLTAALRNLKTVDRQTAPLPYESSADGLWQNATSWTNYTMQNLPYSISIEDPTKTIDWNIVRTAHNITSNGNKTVLGLFVNSNTLTATSSPVSQTDGSRLEVSHYLKLDGKIDLVGRSQLVQKSGSDLDPDSSGSLERDQQGQGNKFNYNYWSSPVGAINNTTNNNNFTVDGVLRDGTNTALITPPLINWINGFDGATSPLSLARYWIYKFDNLANNYANWTQIGETGILQPGKGFTLKGPGSSGTQNLTFVGKPNNGTITNTVGANQLLLVGNPYPSALDAEKFIDDNIGSIETSITDAAIDGALYFWEHYSTNNTHNLGAYQGGYGVYNKSGGVKPSATGVDFISSSGSSSKFDPKRYIPVGQGFFVIGKIGSGGTVTFNNSQREFIKEDATTLSQTMYRIPKTPKDSNHWTDNSNAQIENDTHRRVRLGFNLYNQSFHRQVLLAFMDEKANSEMNDGYDAFNIDDSPSDMYLLNGENELAIQGEGYFDEEASYPIGVRSETTGKISFVLDGLENFDESQNIFMHDNETDTYHSIKDKAYEIELPQGTFNERFSLRFIDKSLAVKDPLYDNAVTVFFTRSNNTLNIKNSANDNTVLTASLYNIQGKLLSKWDVKEKEQSNIKIPIQDKTSALYIVKLKTEKGTISKKIIVK
jgi:hypothetical protein